MKTNMKKLLTLILLSLIGFFGYSQTTMQTHVFFTNSTVFGCCVTIYGSYSNSTTSNGFFGPNILGTVVYPPNSFSSCTPFNDAWIVLPYDTTTILNTIHLGFTGVCLGDTNNVCKPMTNQMINIPDNTIKMYHTPAIFFPICGDTIGTGILTIKSPTKKIVRILDEMGRDTKPVPNKPLIYLYNDGSIERVLTIDNK
jgi:hypothetical protein